MNLYIDDLRNPKTNRDWTVVRSFEEAVEFMEKSGCPNYISFDHDLGDVGTKTGKDIANWLVEKEQILEGRFIPEDFEFNVHSANPVGAENIAGLLKRYLEFRMT